MIFIPAYFPRVTSSVLCPIESGGVPHPAGTDLRVCQPGHGTLCAAQRAADR